ASLRAVVKDSVSFLSASSDFGPRERGFAPAHNMRLIHFRSPLSQKYRRAQSDCSCSEADTSGRDRFSSTNGPNAVLILLLNATANGQPATGSAPCSKKKRKM